MTSGNHREAASPTEAKRRKRAANRNRKRRSDRACDIDIKHPAGASHPDGSPPLRRSSEPLRGEEVVKLSAADRRWSTAVKDRDHWSCRRCLTSYPERSRGLNAHHIFTRSRRSTRHDVECGVSLCVGCHRWAHANSLEFHEWAKAELGEAYDDLQQRSRALKRTGT
jgi:hypothetical protein